MTLFKASVYFKNGLGPRGLLGLLLSSCLVVGRVDGWSTFAVSANACISRGLLLWKEQLYQFEIPGVVIVVWAISVTWYGYCELHHQETGCFLHLLW